MEKIYAGKREMSVRSRGVSSGMGEVSGMNGIRTADAPIYVKSRWRDEAIIEAEEKRLSEEKQKEVDGVFENIFKLISSRSGGELLSGNFDEVSAIYLKYKAFSETQTFAEFVFTNIRKQLVKLCPKVIIEGGEQSRFHRFLVDLNAMYRDEAWRGIFEQRGEVQGRVDERSAQLFCLDALFHFGCCYDLDLDALSLNCLSDYCADVYSLRLSRVTWKGGSVGIVKDHDHKQMIDHVSKVIAKTMDRLTQAIGEELLKAVRWIELKKVIDPLNPWKWPGFSKQYGLIRFAMRYREIIARLLRDLSHCKRFGINALNFRVQNYFFVRAINSLQPEEQKTILRELSRPELWSFWETANPLELMINASPVLLDVLKCEIESRASDPDAEAPVSVSDTEGEIQRLRDDMLEALRLQLSVDSKLSMSVLTDVKGRYYSIMAGAKQAKDFKEFLKEVCGFSERQLTPFKILFMFSS